MANTHVSPTRMELTKLKKKLITARRGHKLLKDKRDELMRQFLEKVQENRMLREKVESQLKEIGQLFLVARGNMRREVFDTALMVPKQEISVAVETNNIMSVNIPVFHFDTKIPEAQAIYCYGPALTTCELDEGIEALHHLLPDMLKLAACEKACELMANEIEKTRRRVNALEHVMIPKMEVDIKYIIMKLDENERSSQIRLMKVKDRMLEAAHHYQQ